MLSLSDPNVGVQKEGITAGEAEEQEAVAHIGGEVTFHHFDRDALYVTQVYADELIAELRERFPDTTDQQLTSGLDCAAAELRGEVKEIELVVAELEDLISQVEQMPISGQPLITDEQFKRLPANAPKDLAEMEHHDPVPAVKIFLPHIRWILCWIYPDDLDRACAVVQWHATEIGDVLLSDIAAARLGRVRPERDRFIKLNQPMSFYLSNPAAW